MVTRNNLKRAIFGLRLRQARQWANLAQDELGVLAGLEESTSSARMSRYESGVHEPAFQFVEVLARILKLSPAYFYCPDDRLAEIIVLYSRMDEVQRSALYDLATNSCESSPSGSKSA